MLLQQLHVLILYVVTTTTRPLTLNYCLTTQLSLWISSPHRVLRAHMSNSTTSVPFDINTPHLTQPPVRILAGNGALSTAIRAIVLLMPFFQRHWPLRSYYDGGCEGARAGTIGLVEWGAEVVWNSPPCGGGCGRREIDTHIAHMRRTHPHVVLASTGTMTWWMPCQETDRKKLFGRSRCRSCSRRWWWAGAKYRVPVGHERRIAETQGTSWHRSGDGLTRIGVVFTTSSSIMVMVEKMVVEV